MKLSQILSKLTKEEQEKVKAILAFSFETLEIAYPMGGGGVKLLKLDETFIGTKNYMGLEYFWHYEYRHYLRDVKPVIRRKVHDALLAKGLKLDEESPEHEKIIKQITGKN